MPFWNFLICRPKVYGKLPFLKKIKKMCPLWGSFHVFVYLSFPLILFWFKDVRTDLFAKTIMTDAMLQMAAWWKQVCANRSASHRTSSTCLAGLINCKHIASAFQTPIWTQGHEQGWWGNVGCQRPLKITVQESLSLLLASFCISLYEVVLSIGR